MQRFYVRSPQSPRELQPIDATAEGPFLKDASGRYFYKREQLGERGIEPREDLRREDLSKEDFEACALRYEEGGPEAPGGYEVFGEEEAVAGGHVPVEVFCELMPHHEDLAGEVLNRPAPQGGAFLVPRRLPEALWWSIESAGETWYWDAEALEDFDMFESRPGWRYSAQALQMMLDGGVSLEMFGEPLETLEGLRGRIERHKAEKRAARERHREEKKAAKIEAHRRNQEAKARFQQKVQELTKGLTKVGGGFATSVLPESEKHYYAYAGGETVATEARWRAKGDELKEGTRRSLARNRSTVTGEDCYLLSIGSAKVLFADTETAEESHRREWSAQVERLGTFRASLDVAATYAASQEGTDFSGYRAPFYRWLFEKRLSEIRESVKGKRVPVTRGVYEGAIDDRNAEAVAEMFGVEVQYFERVPHQEEKTLAEEFSLKGGLARGKLVYRLLREEDGGALYAQMYSHSRMDGRLFVPVEEIPREGLELN